MVIFDEFELGWLRAASARFRKRDLSEEMDMDKLKRLFLDDVQNSLGFMVQESEVVVGRKKIDTMPADEFWKFYRDRLTAR
jgi:hypothetical protein